MKPKTKRCYKPKKRIRKTKTRRLRMRNNSKKGGSGVMLNANDNIAFNTFISNSDFLYMGNGSNGITILAKLKPGIESPYKNLDSASYGIPIESIIIKLIALNHISTIINLTTSINLNTTTITNVVDELNIQTDISLKTMNYLEPLCPVPIYFTEELPLDTLRHMIDNSISSSKNTKNILTSFLNKITTGELSGVSVIAMELASGYKDMITILNKQTIYMAAFIVIKLAVDTGYSQGDYHIGNLMINPTKTGYFKGMSGAPLLLDYGLASKIPPEKMIVIKELFKNKDYLNLLLEISKIPRSDGANLMSDEYDYRRAYGYLQGKWNVITGNPMENFYPEMNTKIGELFTARDAAIQDTIVYFDQLHSTDPKYPLLPLSNVEKNKMYSGIDIHNEYVTTEYIFNQIEIKNTKIIFYWICDVIFKAFPTYNNNQKKCFFIKFCYNFIYIYNSLKPISENRLQLYSLIALLFVDDFDMSTNSDEEDTITFMRNISANAYTDDVIKENILKIAPLFKNKQVFSYAPYLAQKNFSKETLVKLMMTPETYSNPDSVVTSMRVPFVPHEEYIFPYEEKDEL